MATKNDSSTRDAQFEQAARDLAEASGGLSFATQAHAAMFLPAQRTSAIVDPEPVPASQDA